MSVTLVSAGQVIQFPVHENMVELTVNDKCDQDLGHWHCVTHHEPFANQLQKDSHIMSGDHTLVWVCHLHGPETP